MTITVTHGVGDCCLLDFIVFVVFGGHRACQKSGNKKPLKQQKKGSVMFTAGLGPSPTIGEGRPDLVLCSLLD